MTESFPLIVTDMDGTLLDHDSYAFDAALDALAVIRDRGYPLILASSKTRLEMQHWHRRLGLEHPFICENGAAICRPDDTGGFSIEELAPAVTDVLSVLSRLRERGFRFRGFSDLSLAELIDTTGLAPEAAEMAAAREFSEPLQWLDSEQRLVDFLDELSGHALQALQGGRFLTISGRCDKAIALGLLAGDYRRRGSQRIIALGDSPNDRSMLAAADIAVIIKSACSEDIELAGANRVIRSTRSGPAGWQEVMEGLLKELSAEVY